MKALIKNANIYMYVYMCIKTPKVKIIVAEYISIRVITYN